MPVGLSIEDMNYQEALDFLYTSLPVFHREGPGAYKPGLETSLLLDDLFGHPSRRYPTIHIAGTNGKGSTAHSLAAVLQAQGYRTGLYTSPHIFDFGERIRVNGEKIPQDAVVDFVKRWMRLKTSCPGVSPSFFELTSTMAFDWFAKCEVDYAVIETGRGGRLDSTNIITPILSVITNISPDHTQSLGETLEEIAAEKAGIIKEGVPVVIGEYQVETYPVFVAKATEKGSSLSVAVPIEMVEHDNINLYPDTKFGEIRGQLAGSYQRLNTATVLEAVDVLRKTGVAISDEAVRKGLAHVVDLTHLVGRWSTIASAPTTVIDTGHNSGGWERIAEQLIASGIKDVRLVCGFVADKDLAHIFEIIGSLPMIREIFWCQASTPRALPAQQLAERASEVGLTGQIVPDVNTAVAEARSICSHDGLVLVAGSNFLIADLNIDRIRTADSKNTNL